MWVARYPAACESTASMSNGTCKPVSGDWNGSGMYTNFLDDEDARRRWQEYFEAMMEAFAKYREEHIAAYGPDNHMRLTGLHETQSIDKFNYGIANRGASVRVPHAFVNNGYKGYIEDRRPNSQADPYKIISRILKTIEPSTSRIALADFATV